MAGIVAPGLRALLRNLIDYAGMFPPASLTREAAVAKYRGYRGSEHAWMLGRFVVSATQVDEMPEELDGCFAVLSDADLTGANLIGSEVTGADFSGVDFRDADLSGIDFSKANTHGARLGKAYFSRHSNPLLDESYQQSLREDTQWQQGKQRAGFDAEDLDERAHEDWANDE